jgi:hypothetical protein
VLDPARIADGDIVSPLVAALADQDVAIAGIEGLASADLRRYGPAAPGDATAVRAGCYAFRRADAVSKGPMDSRLLLPGSVATWWSLTLRDAGPDAPPRRALSLELPLEPLAEAPLPPDHARLARRDAYRLADLIGDRVWLAEEVGGVPGEGTQHHDQGDDTHHDGHAAEA